MCGRDFVNPVDWEPVGSEYWRILLRCGECETWREVVVTNAVARRYDVELDRRAAVLAASWERLDRERMIAEVEAMTTALRLGLIDAADFVGGAQPRQQPTEAGTMTDADRHLRAGRRAPVADSGGHAAAPPQRAPAPDRDGPGRPGPAPSRSTARPSPTPRAGSPGPPAAPWHWALLSLVLALGLLPLRPSAPISSPRTR